MKLYLTLFLLLATQLVFAQVQVTMEVDSNSISMEEVVGVSVKVTGVRNAPTPQIETNGNFNLQYDGSSSQINIINGNTTISSSFHYQLSPIKPGDFTLGPATVDINGNQYFSDKINIKVTAGSSIPNKERNYYIETLVDKKEAYLGEQILYTFKLYNKVQLFNSSLDLPKFSGFISESLGGEKSVIKIINGVRWKETQLQYLLIPTKTGNLEIPPAVIDAKLVISQSFFGAETKPVRLQSDKIKIQIKDLPLAGRPASYHGLIGNFNITGVLEKNNIKQGESTTLTIEVSGTGDAQDLPEPSINTNDFKIYDDKPTYNKSVENNQIRSRKIFKKAIVPQKAGTITIPPIGITFFNPLSGKYETNNTQSFTIHILPSEKGEEELKITSADIFNSEKKNIKLLATDLMPIFYNSSALGGNLTKSIDKKRLYLLNLIILILYLVLYFKKNFKDKLKLDTGKVRRSKAYNNFIKRFKGTKNTQNNVAELSMILREYLGDKLDIDGKSLTSIDLDRIFVSTKVSPQSLQLLKNIFSTIDSSMFGGISLSINDQNDLLSKTSELVKKLEKELR